MRKVLFLILAGLCAGSCSHRATAPRTYPDYAKSSGFEISAPDSTTLENLDVLGRVWGYVKYHHPVFATNQVDADYELFGLLPQVAQASKEERNTVLNNWIADLGAYESDSTYYKNLLTETDYRWLTHSTWITPDRLGTALCDALQKMKYAPRSSNRYIRQGAGARNPELTNEHTDGRIGDCGYRLLWLYRYWNVIEYFCPNRNLTDRDWDSVLTESLPRIIGASQNTAFWQEYARLNAALNDGHAFGPEFALTGIRRIPALARYFGKRLIVTDADCLKRGDEILTVDGEPCDHFLDRMQPYLAASNPDAAARYGAVLALASRKDSVTVEYDRAGKRHTEKIATIDSPEYYTLVDSLRNAHADSCCLLNNQTAYLHAGHYSTEKARKLMDKIRDVQTLIVDMRCYPKIMVFDFIGRYFIKQPVCHVRWGTPQPTLPGLLLVGDGKLTIGLADRGHNPDPYQGRVIVLCDETTQSAAEYTIMAFQATPRCTVVGSRTAGADGNVSKVPSPFREEGIAANAGVAPIFSGLGVYYPDGSDTQRCGIKIDVEVRPTVEGFRAGRDEVLEKALQIAMQPQ